VLRAPGDAGPDEPPIREARHREALRRAAAAGLVDMVGSDHAPHTLEEKAGEYPDTPSGMTGVQTLVPVLLDHVNAGWLSLRRFVELTSAGPARAFGIARKGRLAPGFDADLTLVDLKRRETVRREWIRSRCGWSPFEGVALTGWPVATVVRGAVVMRDGSCWALRRASRWASRRPERGARRRQSLRGGPGQRAGFPARRVRNGPKLAVFGPSRPGILLALVSDRRGGPSCLANTPPRGR